MLLWAILGSFIVFLFYVLETMVAISLISVIIGGLMSLVYFNQNKLLYMPGKYSFSLSYSQHASFSFIKSFSLQTSEITRA
jgi:hypothetical protein